MYIKNKRYFARNDTVRRHFMQKLNFKDNVSETLLINVYMRHLDFKDTDPILNDPFSSAVVEQIDYDFAKFNDARLSKTGTVIRAKFFDDETLRLAKEFDRPIIVQLGAGLDTRPLRLQSALPSALFYDLDLPDVIAVRDALLPKAENNFSLPYSMLDLSWMNELVAKYGSAGYIFILEGVSMYFEKEEFKKFFIALARKFRGYVLSDFMSKFSVRKFDSKRHDAMRHMQNAPFKMGINGGAEVQSWEPARIRFIKEAAMMKMYREHWSLKARLFSLIPAFCNACKMFVFKIESGDE